MPPPLVVIPSLHVISKAAASAAASVDVYAFSSATVAYILARILWHRIPTWIKEDVALRSLLRNTNRDGGGSARKMEMGTLASVIEKLQAIFRTASEKLVLQLAPVPFLQASLWSYIQLESQLRTAYPCFRRLLYGIPDPIHDKTGGPDRTISTNNLDEYGKVGIADSLDYAIFAYTSDSDQLQRELFLKHADLTLLQHNTLIEKIPRPGQVGHYLAVSHTQRFVVIGIRGTSSLEDFFADCCGQAVSYPNPSKKRYGWAGPGSSFQCVNPDEDYCSPRIEVSAAQPHQVVPNDATIMDNNDYTSGQDNVEVISGHERIWVEEPEGGEDSCNTQYCIRCHEGVLICAQYLVDRMQSTIEETVLEKGYRVLICGHSLGAGVASLAAVVLRTRFPILANDCFMPIVGTTAIPRVQVMAFGPPPVLDHDSAIAACSYTTSIVNNADVIPRASLANLAIFVEFLRFVSTRLQERGIAPTNPATAAFFLRNVLCGVPLPTRYANGVDDDSVRLLDLDPSLLMSLDEVQTAMKSAHREIELRNPDHLYIPGRVVLMLEDRGNTTTAPSWQFEVTDGTAAALRLFEFDTIRMVTDHATASYSIGVGQLSLQSAEDMQQGEVPSNSQ
jgi:pimeloyl-ACP methyl ester carboxylesterase